jgi:hypothetical protein
MKRFLTILIPLVYFCTLAFGCSQSADPVQIIEMDDSREVALIPDTWCGDPTSTTLFAGQDIEIGTVNVYNNEGFIYVDFQVDEPWVLIETHVAVYEDLSDFPTTKKGNPKIGRFDYDINSEIAYDLECGNTLYIASHACVEKLDSDGNTIQEESAWGYGTEFNDGGSWAMYFTHEIQCCFKAPPLPPSDTIVQMRVYTASASYITTHLYNVPDAPDGEDPYEVWDGQWPGWCADEYHTIYIGSLYNANLLSSYDFASWPLAAQTDPRLDRPWDKINYIINHKQGNAVDVQDAIWYFTDGTEPAITKLDAWAMIDDANAYGVGWYPVGGQNMALICWVNLSVQVTFIEVDP